MHPADVQGRDGFYPLLEVIKQELLIWADQPYNSEPLRCWITPQGYRLQVVNRPLKWSSFLKGQPLPEVNAFVMLPRCWGVERTFIWLRRNRRMARNYESQAGTEEPWL